MDNRSVYEALKDLEHRPEQRLQEIREAWQEQNYRYLGLLVSRVLDDYEDAQIDVERSDVAHDRRVDDRLTEAA
jgi:predicted TIM-barrel fold metal-dependent hydrolase